MRTRRQLAFVIAGAMLLPAATVLSCGLDATGNLRSNVPIPVDATDEDAQEIVDATVDGDAGQIDAEAGPCPTTAGMQMVVVAVDGGPFCIDSTEVTNAQYDAFLAATGNGNVDAGIPEAGLPMGCLTAGTFLRAMPANGGPQAPVTYVTWCSAYAYCQWAGKRLCGASLANGAVGEWYMACSDEGARLYPYGASHEVGACNDSTSAPEGVGTRTSCEGGVPGLYDMTGNVGEFVDGCNVDLTLCHAAGGGYTTGPAATCTFRDSYYPATSTDPTVGFRCCADSR